MNKDQFANYTNRSETDGITFYKASNLAIFLCDIVKQGMTYSVAHMPFDDSNDEFWIVTLTGGF